MHAKCKSCPEIWHDSTSKETDPECIKPFKENYKWVISNNA